MIKDLSEESKKLIGRYRAWQQSREPDKSVSTIHVDEVASKVAAFYEHIRTVVEWKEEHLMRRAAIIRKLKRRFLDFELNNFNGTDGAGESLVLELIRGGHFPNDKIEEIKIKKVQDVIEKYIFILKNNPESKKGKAGLQFYNWLLEVCSCEIEETLSPLARENALIKYMFGIMKERIKVNENIYKMKFLKEEDKNIQIFIAVQQALLKLDRPMISYNLLRYKHPEWENASEHFLFNASQRIYKIWKDIESDISCPISKKFYMICEKYDTPYLLIGDILSQKNSETIEKEIKDPAVFEGFLRSAYKKRLSQLKAKITRAAVYSTVSIFATKILTLVLLEVFLSKILTGDFNSAVLIFDILIPTMLMFWLVSSAKAPSEKNLNLVIIEAMKILYKNENLEVYEIKTQRKRSVTTRMLISFVYTLSAFLSFGFIYWIFKIFGFPITSIIVNIIFIALIIFAGNAVRKRAEELTIEDEKEGFLSFMSDVFFLPVASMGRWLSNKWKQYNAIAAFFNAMIDMPFSVFVEFIERWRYFIKERKEEIQ